MTTHTHVVVDPKTPVLYLRQPTDDQLESVMAWLDAKQLKAMTVKECKMQWSEPVANFHEDQIKAWSDDVIKQTLIDAGGDPGRSRRPGLIKKLLALTGVVQMEPTIAISLQSNVDPNFHSALLKAYPPAEWGINAVVEVEPQPPESMKPVMAEAFEDPQFTAEVEGYPVADDGKMPF